MEHKGAGGNNEHEIREATVRYIEVKEGQFPGEVVVILDSTSGRLTGIFPSSSVNITMGTVNASIIEEEGDQYLVALPTYTFTSGSRVWFLKDHVRFAGGV